MKIAAQVPKSTEELFAYELDWTVFSAHRILDLKVAPWISKKVTEFLGEEEPELVSFISSKLKLALKPSELVKELKEFLDEDAEGFIVKLWKLLVFEDLRLKQQGKIPA